MKAVLVEIPRTVLIAVGVLIGTAVIYGLLAVYLGGALEEAIARNGRLKSEIQQTQNNIERARDDYAYVDEHKVAYEELLNSDRLIPHTRRAAAIELQRVARLRGITSLNYVFEAAPANSLVTVQAQPTSGNYRLSVENVRLTIGAPLDGPIYGFISDISQSFPGAAVVELVTLNRAPGISESAIAALSNGTNSGLVTGEIQMSWRTAQAEAKAGGGK